jgi:hypothetical protein
VAALLLYLRRSRQHNLLRSNRLRQGAPVHSVRNRILGLALQRELTDRNVLSFLSCIIHEFT